MVAACPLPEQTHWVSNYQSRTKSVKLAALHESVGGAEAISLAIFTQNAGVSYHAIADNDKLVYTVPRSKTAWHIRNGNSRADGLCLCSPTKGYSRAEWLGPQRNKVEVAAWWLALVCADRGIDLKHCSYAEIRAALAGNGGGGTTHNDYTQATGDGTHTDPRNFPFDVCIERARTYAGEPPTPTPTPAPAEDDLTPEQAQQLADVHAQLTTAWPGWRWNLPTGQKQPAFTLVDYVRALDQQFQTRYDLAGRPAAGNDSPVGQLLSLRAELAELSKKVDTAIASETKS